MNRLPISALDSTISDTTPHIFKRPILSVIPSDSLLQVGTFLAIGPQIYVDGLVVFDGSEPVGRIGGSHIIQHILQHERDWFHFTASDIMSHESSVVDASKPLTVALDIFWRTRFAFVPVGIGGKVMTTLSLRDILRAVDFKVDLPAEKLASQLVSVDHMTTLRSALELMLTRGIRNLVVTNGQESLRLLNDRKILEFLLSHEGRLTTAGPNGLDSVRVNQLDLLNPRYLKKEASARIAAGYLSEISTPCLLFEENKIITPWDIVMKGMRG